MRTFPCRHSAMSASSVARTVAVSPQSSPTFTPETVMFFPIRSSAFQRFIVTTPATSLR